MVYIRANGVVLNIGLRGRGEPVVLISDIGEDLTSWGLQSPSFGGLHFLMQVDNRGSGWSECPDSCPIDAMARDIVCLMDLIGVDRTHLVGLGLGGMIALEITLQRPGRVGGLVLVSTSPSMTLDQKLVYSSWIAAAKEGQDLKRISACILPWLYSPWFLDNDNWREYLIRARAANYRSTSWDGAERQLEGMKAFRSSDRLSRIAAPTLVLSGSEDLLTPTSCSEELAANIGNARTHIVNAGHMLHVELPVTFNKVVLEFLAEVEGSPLPRNGPALPSSERGPSAPGAITKKRTSRPMNDFHGGPALRCEGK